MWNAIILTALISVAGYYTVIDQKYMLVLEESKARHLANDMAIYRNAVIDYFSANPALKSTKVPDNALVFPSWHTRIATPTAKTQWDNYIDADGTIYIYALSSLPVNITSDIVALAKNSILVGEESVVDGKQALYSPADVEGAKARANLKTNKDKDRKDEEDGGPGCNKSGNGNGNCYGHDPVTGAAGAVAGTVGTVGASAYKAVELAPAAKIPAGSPVWLAYRK